MKIYNPKRAIDDLRVILSNPNKKIGFLFGAGISIKDKNDEDLIPGVKKMTQEVVKNFSKSPEKEAIQIIKKEIEDEKNLFNIESLLSKISEKERAAGMEKLCGLSKAELKKLRDEIEEQIKKLVSIHKEVGFLERKLNHHDFARWIRNGNRESPVEIFTVNYDYLLELALEKQQIPYFDGFVGSFNAFFCPEWIEDGSAVKNWTKLWKLHGSLGWELKGDEIVRNSGGANSAMIYPSFLKYDHSRKQPYLSYMDRLSFFLRQEDSVLFVCGYSFGDEHINEMLVTGLSRSRTSCVFVLKSGELDENDNLSNIAKNNSKISVYAVKTAVVGCDFVDWQLSSEEESTPYFKESRSSGKWDGKGDLLLGNFSVFTDFLSTFNQRKLIK